MTQIRLVVAALLSALAGCTIPIAEPIGASRLTVGRTPTGAPVVEVRGCPDWARGSREDFSNRTSGNFGCADALNFVGQLARPEDAIRGRGTGDEQGEAASTAIERYRAHKATPIHNGDAVPAAAPAPGNPS